MNNKFSTAKNVLDMTGNVVSITTQCGDITMSIPLDPANTDYQEYLAWLAEGNTPLLAD